MTHRFFAVVPAAGVGSRFGSQIPKQYTEIAGQAVLLHTVQLLLANETLAGVAVVLSPDDGYFKDLTCLHGRKPSVYTCCIVAATAVPKACAMASMP